MAKVGILAAVSGAALDGAEAFLGALRRAQGAGDTNQNAQSFSAAESHPLSMMLDPMSQADMSGYQERPSNLSYDSLRMVYHRLPVISTVINTRVNQCAQFAVPARTRFDMGFRIRLRDDQRTPNEGSRAAAQAIEDFLLNTGVTDNPRGRDSFEMCMRKIVRDSLLYDQYTIEVVPSRSGRPAEFYAVDASTIRLAHMPEVMDEDDTSQVRYVQLYNGSVAAEYTQERMIFGVRNPTSDLRLHGYGTSELELIASTVTSLLNALSYNSLFFSQGTMAKGIINIKDQLSTEKMNEFKRDWWAMLRGEQNAWKMPVVQAPGGLEYMNLGEPNNDMQFGAWLDFLIKVACSAYNMDPSEINFKYGSVGVKSALSEDSNRDKLIESRERGLRPLLRNIAGNINQYIIQPLCEDLGDEFILEFVGLDSMTREELTDYNARRVTTSYTVNEVRAEDDRPPLEGGDVILNPAYLQSIGVGAPVAATSDPATAGMYGLPLLPDGTMPMGSQNSDVSSGPAPGYEADDEDTEDAMQMGIHKGMANWPVRIDLTI